jgi:hypothetical protein
MLRRLHPGWMFLAVLVASPATVLGERIVSAPVTRVEVLLSVAPTLSVAVRATMLEEAAAIWRRQDVAIEWLPAKDDLPRRSNRLRALVVDRPARPHADGPFAVGELVRTSNSHPIALISIERAERLLASARGAATNELLAVSEQRLGIVLGRALAHEIGHFLLGTATHARRGLMRPHFDAVEFTDLRDGIFALDQDAAAWLRTGSAEKFAYASR